MSEVYAPENLERYYRMRKKGASSGASKEASKPPKVPQGETAKPTQEDLFHELLGKNVSARLLDGSTMRGKLETVTKYELLLKTEGGKDVVVFKHAVAYVLPERTAAF